jgi:hypothetical protein
MMYKQMLWYLYSIVIGSTMFAYIQLFNRNMQAYKKSDYTMSWGNFIDETSFYNPEPML